MLWGRSPWVFATLALLYGALDRKSSPLSPVLRSLITVRVSQINHCEFCVDINSATLVKRGVPENKIEALWEWRESSLFDQTERAALEYAEAVTHSELRVDEALMARVKEHFDDDTLVELTGLIAFQNLSSKFNDALNVAPRVSADCLTQTPTTIPDSSRMLLLDNVDGCTCTRASRC